LQAERGASLFSNPIHIADICGSSSDEQKASWGTVIDVFTEQFKKIENTNIFGEIRENNTSRFGTEGPIANLAKLMFFTLFTPFVGLMLTLSAFKVFSPLIGGDVEISLLSRLI
ncbi:MAG: hypothetical protein QW275_03435, partial [Candidatus Anstonellaceae archaeon]